MLLHWCRSWWNKFHAVDGGFHCNNGFQAKEKVPNGDQSWITHSWSSESLNLLVAWSWIHRGCSRMNLQLKSQADCPSCNQYNKYLRHRVSPQRLPLWLMALDPKGSQWYDRWALSRISWIFYLFQGQGDSCKEWGCLSRGVWGHPRKYLGGISFVWNGKYL